MTTTQYIKAEDLEEGQSFRFTDGSDPDVYVLVHSDWTDSAQPLQLHWRMVGLNDTGRTSHSPDEIVELV